MIVIALAIIIVLECRPAMVYLLKDVRGFCRHAESKSGLFFVLTLHLHRFLATL